MQYAKDHNVFPSQTDTQNTRQNSDLNEDISSPWADRPKGQAVGQPPNENQQLLLRTRQLQLPQEEHRLTAERKKSIHQMVTFALLCLSELLTWIQRRWRGSSRRLWHRTQRSPAPPGCWSPADLDSAWWSWARRWTTQPAGMGTVMTQT